MNLRPENFLNYSKLYHEKWMKDLSIFIFLALLVILKFWDYLNPRGEFYWVGDFLDVTPMREYFYSNLKKGILILWDPHIATGMPYLGADYGVFYPIDLLMGVLSQNYFVPYRLSLVHAFHYWLGGIFAFIYTRQLGLSRIPALISSICFMLGGFLMGHAYHRDIIQTYIWFPLILYLLDKALHQRSAIWAVLSGVFLTVSFLAGYAGIFYFIVLFLAAYYLFTIYGRIRQRAYQLILPDTFYFMIPALFCLGLSAVQLLPILFTSLNSYHATLPFEWKAQGPFSLFNLIHFLIPDYTRWTAFDIGEQYGYIGLFPALMAFWGIKSSKDTRIRFFGLVALFAFVASLGELTPLFKIFYYTLPGLKTFRIPARFNALIIFPLAILAGFGFQHFFYPKKSEGNNSAVYSIKGLLFLTLGVGILIFLVLFYLLYYQEAGGQFINPWIQLRKGFLWFLILWGASYLIVSWKGRKISGNLVKMGVVFLISLDLLFLGRIEGGGWTTNPALFSPQSEIIIQTIRKSPSPFRIDNGEKQLSPRSLYREGISDYDVDNLVGHIGRVVPREYLGVYFLTNKNPMLLDLLNVRYYIGSKLKMNTGPEEQKIGGKGEDKEFFLNYPIKISSLTLYTALADSTSIQQGQTVARIHFQKKDGSSQQVPMRAGIETAEWAIDRPGLKCLHQKARVAESWEVSHEGYQGHVYFAKTSFPDPIEVSKIGFEYLGVKGSLTFKKILINDLEMDAIHQGIIDDRVQLIAPNIYENKFCLPRVYMIGKAKAVAEEKELLINIEQLDPRDHVLLNHLPPYYREPVDSAFSTQEAEINHYSSGKIKITTKALADKVLILSDTYSPYWKATIDQKPSPILKANYGLRGLYVPKGGHQIDFIFHFFPFYYGLVITLVSLSGVILLTLYTIWRNTRGGGKP